MYVYSVWECVWYRPINNLKTVSEDGRYYHVHNVSNAIYYLPVRERMSE